MLGKADRELLDVIRFFAARGLEAGYLVPTETGLEKSIMDAHGQLAGYLRRAGLHDYSKQPQGGDAKVILKTWFVKEDSLLETKSSLYRPEAKTGDPRIWIYDLSKYVGAGNLLALFGHERELYVVNASEPGLLESATDPSSPFSRVLDLLAAARNKPLDDKFSEWNLRLLRSFFSEASKGEEVFLRVEKELLDQIGQDIGGDAAFLEAVRTGPTWVKPNSGMADRMLALVSQRKIRTRDYRDPGEFDPVYRGLAAPAYLPYLAALVRNDAENSGAYYEGLRRELRLEAPFGPPEMGQVEAVWDDLQSWTTAIGGRFGYFKLRRLGGLRRIGVPRSQAILKSRDIENLPRVFVQAQIRPGQDLAESELARILDEARATDWLFTVAFQKALNTPDFEQPIRAAISTAYSDWDGTLPPKGGVDNGRDSQADSGNVSGPGIGLGLTVVNNEPLRLAPRWRLPAFRDSGRFEVIHGDLKWNGHFAGTDGAKCDPSPNLDEAVWSIVGKACDEGIQFTLRFANSDSEPTEQEITLGEHRLWILIPSYDHASGDIELQEGDLPGSGQAFLLAPPRNVPLLRSYLAREEPEHRVITALGLPEDWLLVCLPECGSLNAEQRLLPDGADSAHPKPRVIRFVGGRSIRRGYSRMYLPYDLPAIELDAARGTIIVVPEGISIEEEVVATEMAAGDISLEPPRRFKLKVADSKSASFEIKAVKDGHVLGQARLRISGLGGELVNTGSPFSVDSLGRPLASNEGLRGVITPASSEEENPSIDADFFSVRPSDLGVAVADRPFDYHARQKFLDALALSGGLDYGVARDLLQRLLQSSGEPGEPPFILLELRSRGDLEISTTHKGHIARIHPVEPTLYSLPVRCANQHVWAVAGTLRLAHWNAIANEHKAWSLHRRNALASPWNLLIANDEEAVSASLRLGLRHVDIPCMSVSDWSASVDTVKDEVFRNHIESIGRANDGAMRFNASEGLFTARPAGGPCELWKIRDLDTGMDNLYVLANEGKFAFVRDSRWGVWIALGAFARWVSRLPGMDGVYPMPIPYSASDGTIWLPARISLPSLLERALVVCSGEAPKAIKLQRSENQHGGDRIHLSSHERKWPTLSVNRFYDDMAVGKWLAYRWVPESIARRIAEKLGAVLDVI